MTLIEEKIKKLKEEKNAIIVAHTYISGEVQEIADMVGDSFALSKFCNNLKEEIIVFCGVRFMAESAKILSPSKKVLLPVLDAGCPMADMINEKELKKLKNKYPLAKVVCYINSTAEVKAQSDICCTSSNAIDVVKSIKEKDIIFVPDKNLGQYVASNVPEKNIILWDGCCPVHDNLKIEEVIAKKEKNRDAIFLVHPECSPQVLKEADYIGSTKQIIDYAKNSKNNKFLIGTEEGTLYSLKKDSPNKEFETISSCFVCKDMKKTTLNDVLLSLEQEKFEIKLKEDIMVKAKLAMDRMLKI